MCRNKKMTKCKIFSGFVEKCKKGVEELHKKEHYLEILSEMENIAYKEEIDEGIQKAILNLKQRMKDFKILVPIVGGFSAGKTSLINCFLGNDQLPTDIRPETAIAAEIRYGQTEKILAYHKNGKVNTYPIEKIKEIPVDDYKYIQVFQNNKKLLELDDIVMVDMPGLDSKLDAHNKAILNYIKEGVYYIVVTEVDYGLKESILDFLSEINMYHLDFSVVISKTDHKTLEDVEAVFNKTKQTICQFVEKDVFVGKTSTKEKDIEDFENILKNIDKNKAFENKFKDEMITLINKSIRELVIRIKYQSLDTTEIETKIAEIKTKLKDIEIKIKEEEAKIEEKFENEVKNNILNDLKDSLNGNIYSLVQAAKNGNESFSQTVNEIIRPIITTSTNQNISFVLQESFHNINMNAAVLLNMAELLKSDTAYIKDAFQKSTSTIIHALNGKSTNQKFMEATYKTISGTLAITTSVVAPWLEIIIFLLPDLLKLLGVGSERRQDEKIQSKIQHEVIPQIIMRLQPEISKYLQKAKDEFIINLHEKVEESKSELIASLNKVTAEKELQETDFENKKERMKESIQQLQELMVKL